MNLEAALIRRDLRRRLASFTLVELLVVMGIIAILMALVISAGNALFIKAQRSRAAAEIQAMGVAAEAYKGDNGVYPQGDGNLGTNNSAATTVYTAQDGTGAEYQTNSWLLFSALSGQTNFTVAPVAGIKVYMSFKPNQVTTPANGYTYIHDPFNVAYAYGYSTGSPAGATSTFTPYNGSGFFDLWSTGGVTSSKYQANNSLTNAWICNWTQ